MNKFSNNYVAEMLTKNLGTIKKQKAVTLADGMAVINEHMQSLQIPNDKQHLHFGKGQTETVLELPPGRHTLQLVLADADHVPHDPPIMSKKITITVRADRGQQVSER
jgi:hypothetical protein